MIDSLTSVPAIETAESRDQEVALSKPAGGSIQLILELAQLFKV